MDDTPTDDPRGLIPFIHQTAARYQIDPSTAVDVARSEGLMNFASTVPGEQSYGAFQLNMLPGSMGSDFQKETGLNPADPANEKLTIDYALRRASQEGWGAFHGAKSVGISNYTGIGRRMPDDDLLGTWSTAPQQNSSGYVPVSSGGGITISVPAKSAPVQTTSQDDLLGSWNTQSAPAAIAATPAAPASPPADETIGQQVARLVAEHQGPGWGDTALRAGAGAVRGIGDVGDTLATAIAGTGRYGAQGLASLGMISPQTAGNVGNWADVIERNIAGEHAAFDAAAAGSPLAQTARIGGEVLGSAPFVEAFPEMGTTPLARAVVGGAGAGGTAAALTSSASDQPFWSQVGTGMLAGGVLGPTGLAASAAGRGVRNLVMGTVDPDTAALANAARGTYGIPVTAGQISSAPSARFLDSVLQRLPFTGYASRTADQQSAFNRAVAQTFGENTDTITPQTIRNAKTRIGQVFDDVATRTGAINVDPAFLGDLHHIEMNARSVLPSTEVAPLRAQMRNIADTIDFPSGTISPESYQALTRKGAPLDRAMQSKDPNVRFYAGQIRDAVDDVMQRSAPPDAVQDLVEARSQYKAMKTVEPLAKKATTGDISPALLLGKVNASYSGNGAALGEIGRIGQRFLKEPPSSGTSERLMAMHALRLGLGAAGLGGAYEFDPENFQRNALLAGLALGAGRGGSAILRSNMLANAMIRGGLGVPAARQPLVDLLTRAAPVPALAYRGTNQSAGQ
jgi:hypothetical protein